MSAGGRAMFVGDERNVRLTGEKDGKVSGYDLELWHLVVQRMQQVRGVDVQMRVVSVDEAHEAVRADPLAVALGGMAITLDGNTAGEFTYSYFHTGLDAAISVPEPTTDPLLFFSPFTVTVWITGVVALYLSGHIIWALEHPYQPELFPLSYLRGVNEGVWYCWGVLSETGENDLVGFPARLYSIGWTTFTVTLVAAYTAQLTTILNSANLRSDVAGLRDLGGSSMAVVLGSDGERFVRDHLPSVAMYGYANVTDAFGALERGAVSACMADATTLEYLADSSTASIRLLGSLLSSADYAMLLANSSPYLDRINSIVLDLTREGLLRELNVKYFGKAFISSIGAKELDSPALTLAAISGVYFVVALGLALAIICWVFIKCCFCC
ncbi:uncharacterized protein AMSG_10279 [Thecamonas trahens ATCC 50062]|uniref:Ionotropic glutamate receptor C-terminal domain-containing protein n=1 Tax=Thecamonas trahens ATCC 50062 TaxID=461836 RepID=A0A0L0DS68_THETB|nr:hypothetical protein AMSG_10279 [Thecamonas trahens ATCC 50062]KNC54298.1 hypothetical protein AMSG_10279 [Thecamonas trahens ATCC 50062]|eukprot:XP_013753762.1 hypothetical protein AMSG_10279 [Thecamonas trahens ATCC 50062]